MGTATHSISKSGYVNPNVRGAYVTSGAHVTSTTASNLTDGAAGAGSAVSANRGDILTIQGDEDMRVMFGDVAATASVGHYVPADTLTDLEISGSGAISIIDIA